MQLTKYLNILLLVFCITLFGRKGGMMPEVKMANIDFESSGCFHYAHEVISISKKNDSLFASLRIKGKPDRKVCLTSEQTEAFRRFISELETLPARNGCTTVDFYEVAFNNRMIKKEDGGCGWNGFDTLKKSLFANTTL